VKIEALNVLVCPRCKTALTLTKQKQEDAEIVTGQLDCYECHRTFPIVRGVPRFVNAESYASSFGRQWNWFRSVQLDSRNGGDKSARQLQEVTEWRDADYKGALLLDAGVGAGRYAECAAKQGAQVFGVDLSSAIDAAYSNIGRLANLHLVQADIFAMPFRNETFDLAYSIGVLHHTPDPRKAFDHVAAAVKPGGKFAIYVYDRYGLHFTDLWRKITTRLPHSLMAVITLAAIPSYYIYRLPLIGKILQHLAPISMVPNWRERWLDTFDWYTPRYQWKYLYPEIFRWFHENRFNDIAIADGPIRMRGVKA
jgi:SAM-dependent methyltransferase